jgi:hypothetical protein
MKELLKSCMLLINPKNFPVKKVNDYFPVTKNETGQTVCPYCGHASFARYEYAELECLSCDRKFLDLGILGWKEVKNFSKVEFKQLN